MFLRGDKVKHRYKDIECIVIGYLGEVLVIMLPNGRTIYDYEGDYKKVKG